MAEVTRKLTDAQRAHYREHGWLSVPGLVDASWLDAAARGHRRVRRAEPRAHRVERDLRSRRRALRRRAAAAPAQLADRSARDVLGVRVDSRRSSTSSSTCSGPNVKFHHSKLNFKAPRGGEEVKWHQDIQFWPHTNYDLLTIGVFLEDVEPGMGEVGFVSGQPRRSALRPVRRRRLGRRARRRRRRARRRRARRVPDRPGRHDHGAQLPDRARLGAEPLGPRPPAAAADLRAGRRVSRTPISCSGRRTARS